MQNPVEDVLAAAAAASPGCAFTAQLVSHSARNESGTAGQQVRQAEQDLHGCCSQTEPLNAARHQDAARWRWPTAAWRSATVLLLVSVRFLDGEKHKLV